MESNLDQQKVIKTDEHTITSGWLDVGHGHKVWYEQWGNPKAKTVILSFHGGPGGGYKPHHKYRFDPKMHQVICFDQRGCGNSLPYGRTDHNRTEDLIGDAATILKTLKIDKVHLIGGSWDSTLALLFAIKYPKKSLSLITTGVFTGTEAEINWLDKGLFVNHYPEVWERFKQSVPDNQQGDPAAYHYKILSGSNKQAWPASAKALSELERPIMQFDWPGFNDIKPDQNPAALIEAFDYVPYKIYAWYLNHNCFLSGDYILRNAHEIKVPTYIIQGRYDFACPPITAYKLHKAISGSRLFMTLDNHRAGHETDSVFASLISTIY